MTAPDHYATLGILQTATVDEVKKAYRLKAKVTHPDKNGGTKSATLAFQKVVDAYECLSDSYKRATYDINYKPSATSTPTVNTSGSSFYSSSNTQSRSNYSQTNSSYNSSSNAYRTPPDLEAEEIRFNEKWRSHNLRKAEVEGERLNLMVARVRIINLTAQERKVKEELRKRKEEWELKTKQSWLMQSLWGRVASSEAEMKEKEKKDRENYDQISSIRIKLAKLDREIKAMEEKEKEWDRQEVNRLRELQALEARKRSRKAAYEAEANRKAEEAKRKAEEARQARQAREKAERERLEKLRKAREEEEKRRREKEEERRREEQKKQEEMYREQERIYEERRRKARDAEQRRQHGQTRKEIKLQIREERLQQRNQFLAERKRQRKEQEAQEREAQEQARRNQNPTERTPTRNAPSSGDCSHSRFWNKVTITSEECSQCHKNYRSFLFQCPGCEMRACASCRNELKGKPRNG
ncbi:hypothetical protein AA313_de0208336 [Arthrobotrys entomopaga]|nr:hypothetical protein AA313_de0208336 [Arthrobotrys entomopaga]